MLGWKLHWHTLSIRVDKYRAGRMARYGMYGAVWCGAAIGVTCPAPFFPPCGSRLLCRTAGAADYDLGPADAPGLPVLSCQACQ
jgi:hypothetical protein